MSILLNKLPSLYKVNPVSSCFLNTFPPHSYKRRYKKQRKNDYEKVAGGTNPNFRATPHKNYIKPYPKIDHWRKWPQAKLFPNNRKFEVTGKDVSQYKWGGDKKFTELFCREIHQPGLKHPDGQFEIVPEMVPEFVVPDLKGFKLLPYVSYRSKKVQQSELTARNLFDAFYANRVASDYRKGLIKDVDQYVKDNFGRPCPSYVKASKTTWSFNEDQVPKYPLSPSVPQDDGIL